VSEFHDKAIARLEIESSKLAKKVQQRLEPFAFAKEEPVSAENEPAAVEKSDPEGSDKTSSLPMVRDFVWRRPAKFLSLLSDTKAA
jgi:hypothetical protein